jgi:hypothetical protein
MARGSILAGGLVIPKDSGSGIKTDADGTPAYAWRDLIGEIAVRGIGGTDPAYSVFLTGIRAHQFTVNDECWNAFHVPHDYAPGTDLYIHAHWAHNSASVTTGAVTWVFDVTYAKGYDQAAFPAVVSPSVAQNASTTQYRHMIAEVQLSAASPSATQLDSDNIEVDGLILVRTYLSANTMSAATEPFLLFVDLHYQTTGMMGTKNKNTPFYT